jgi:hypothetical protein
VICTYCGAHGATDLATVQDEERPFCDQRCAINYYRFEPLPPATEAVVARIGRDVSGEPQKTGKTPFELLDLPFVGAMARQLGGGLARPGRVADGWKDLDPAEWLPKYRAAALRHLLDAERVGARDPESGESHYAAVAVNAMICAYLEARLVGVAPLLVSEVVAALAERFELTEPDAIEFALDFARKLEAQQTPPVHPDQLRLAIGSIEADTLRASIRPANAPDPEDG